MLPTIKKSQMKKFNNTKSFFEHMKMADSERIHSEFISWFFSDDCQAITEKQRIKTLNNIFKLRETDKILNIGTEIDKIDIFIETNNHILIIENKLKSSQHSNQLSEYKKNIEFKYPKKQHQFIFLTLIKEQAKSDGWIHISYHDLRNFLEKLELTKHRHSIFIHEYVIYLNRLLYILDEVINKPKEYDSVFINGSLKKSDKLHHNYKNNKEKFIAENQLETIFQKAFLTDILAHKSFFKFNAFVTETRGVALVDFSLKRDINYNNRIYTTFIQMQGANLKFSFAIQDNYIKSKKEWIVEIIEIFKSYKHKFGYKRINSPKSKAYVSLSKKMEKPYWLLENNEFYSIINTEIENGIKLSNILISDIEKVSNNR